VGSPLLKSALSPSQWEIIEYISHALRQDYEVRRQMILQRLDVTIQSFTWSDRLVVICISVIHKYVHVRFIFRSTLRQSRPDKAGLKCPSMRAFPPVRPSVHKKFLPFQ